METRRVLYKDKNTTIWRDGCNLVDEHVSGAKVTSYIDENWTDKQVAEKFRFTLIDK